MNFVSQPATELPMLSLAFPVFSFNEPLLTFSWLAMALLASYIVYRITLGNKLSYIPAIGGSDLLSSYWSALNFTTQAKYMVQTGYEMVFKSMSNSEPLTSKLLGSQHKDGVFRIPLLSKWNIIVSRRKHIEEIATAKDDVFSPDPVFEEVIFQRYLIDPSLMDNRYHVELVRVNLTRNLGNLFDAVNEEIVMGFEENIPATDEWKTLNVYPAITQIVARASNRIFVGLPLCRTPGYLDLCISFAHDVHHSSDILRRTPQFLRRIVASMLISSRRNIQSSHKYLEPIIKERQKKIDQYGPDYPEKPNDFLTWLMDNAQGEERSSLKLTTRILNLNMAAIHTSSFTFTQALVELAVHPKYLAPLREEVETVVKEDGWSKVAMTKMHKVDSFLKESHRMNGFGIVSLGRKALKDYTFSDGTFIPKGAVVQAASRPIHFDEDIYPNAGVFDGFRFSDIREKAGREITNQFVNTNPTYLPFGHGRRACPGRFFAANELKAMFAHLVLNYDVKMEDGGARPVDIWSGFLSMPNRDTRVMFRRRQT